MKKRYLNEFVFKYDKESFKPLVFKQNVYLLFTIFFGEKRKRFFEIPLLYKLYCIYGDVYKELFESLFEVSDINIINFCLKEKDKYKWDDYFGRIYTFYNIVDKETEDIRYITTIKSEDTFLIKERLREIIVRYSTDLHLLLLQEFPMMCKDIKFEKYRLILNEETYDEVKRIKQRNQKGKIENIENITYEELKKKINYPRDSESYNFSLQLESYIYWRDVPHELYDEELYLTVIIDPHELSQFMYIHPNKLTYRLCIEAVKHDFNNYEYLPKKYRTVDIYKAAKLNFDDRVQNTRLGKFTKKFLDSVIKRVFRGDELLFENK
jgi:hypothetical protein